MLGSFRTFVHLAPAKRRVALDALFLLPLCAAGLYVLGFKRMMDIAGSRPLTQAPATELTADAHARIVIKVADRLFPTTKCLVRSLAILNVLRRHGIASELRIGVNTSAGKLDAHAWVECEGMVLNETDEVCSTFAPLSDKALPGLVHWR